mmetsp:Transcript_23624/g.37017  ORF Transcript_23624/g.37017 Transcript_23624/m.37017 type:complete len:213 (-) Transcript_23624:150-788(-)
MMPNYYITFSLTSQRAVRKTLLVLSGGGPWFLVCTYHDRSSCDLLVYLIGTHATSLLYSNGYKTANNSIFPNKHIFQILYNLPFNKWPTLSSSSLSLMASSISHLEPILPSSSSPTSSNVPNNTLNSPSPTQLPPATLPSRLLYPPTAATPEPPTAPPPALLPLVKLPILNTLPILPTLISLLIPLNDECATLGIDMVDDIIITVLSIITKS